MSSTMRWIIRVVGALMMIFFAYFLCAMQNDLMQMQRQRGTRGAEEEAAPDRPQGSE